MTTEKKLSAMLEEMATTDNGTAVSSDLFEFAAEARALEARIAELEGQLREAGTNVIVATCRAQEAEAPEKKLSEMLATVAYFDDADNDRYSDEARALEERVAELEDGLHAANDVYREVTARVGMLQSLYAQTEASNHELTARVAELEGRLSSRALQIRYVTTRAEAAEAKYSDLSGAFTELESEYGALRESYAAAEAEVTRLEAQLYEACNERDVLHVEVAQYEVANAKQHTAWLDDKLTALRGENASLMTHNTFLRKENERFTAQLDAVRVECEKHEDWNCDPALGSNILEILDKEGSDE